MSPATIWLLAALGALTLGGLLSAMLAALQEASWSRLRDRAATRRSSRTAAMLERVLNDPAGHAAALALPRSLCHAATAGAFFFWFAALRGLDLPTLLDLGLGVALAGALIWSVGSIIPLALARYVAEETFLLALPLTRLCYMLTAPLRGVAALLDEIVRRLVGKPRGDQEMEVKEEVLWAVSEAAQEGGLDQAESRMIRSVVKFRDLTVSQIMTPRTEIQALELTDNLGEITAFLRKGSHSRIPVYEQSLDRIVGFFYVKDLVLWLSNQATRAGKAFTLRDLLRPAIFVPETKTVRELLGELLAKRVHIAVVADEYGGTAGLVTFEDIIEPIFGDIQDEYEKPELAEIAVAADPASKVAAIDARTSIDEANAALKPLGVELPPSEDYDTVGGYVSVTMGHIPAAGETLKAEGYTITVTQAEPMRIRSVRLQATS